MNSDFTKAFFSHIEGDDGIKGKFVPLAELASFLDDTPEARALSFHVCTDDVEIEIVEPKFGATWRRLGRGRSWGHIQHGYICAGAGGLNSSPIMKIK